MSKPEPEQSGDAAKSKLVEALLRWGTRLSWLVLLTTMAVAAWFLRGKILDWSVAFTILGGAASIVAYGLTLIIARAQDYQLRDLTTIATDTKVTAHKLQTDSVLEEEGKAFFNLGAFPADNPDWQYRCYRTARPYDSVQDLPYTPVAEDFCVQELQRVFSACKTKMHLENVFPGTESPSIHRIQKWHNFVFLRSAHIPKSLVDPSELPCWFHGQDILSNGKPAHASNTDMSIGILARLRRGNEGQKRLVLIEGKTQAGTWIVGHFFSQLMARAKFGSISEQFLKAITSQPTSDIIVVVAGLFDTNTYEVQGNVQIVALWVKSKDDPWIELNLNQSWTKDATPNVPS